MDAPYAQPTSMEEWETFQPYAMWAHGREHDQVIRFDSYVTDDQGGMARLEARTGTLDTQKEQMKLEQDVHVRTDAGQAVDLRSAFVDFKAGTVVSTEPVSVSLGSGVIEAKGMRVSDNGRIMLA